MVHSDCKVSIIGAEPLGIRPKHDEFPATLSVVSFSKKSPDNPPENDHVLAHQRDGGSRVFAKGQYGRRSRGVL